MDALQPLPAHQTQHLPTLTYPFHNSTFHLTQLSDGVSNGTALWLGAQVLSAYVACELGDLRSSKRPNLSRRPRVVELGSGIGLTALALSSLGYDVLATDTAHVCDSVLRRNVSANIDHLPAEGAGTVQVRVLDWHVDSGAWAWHDPTDITSPTCSCEVSGTDVDEDILRPPFDLIVSSDTLYDASLIDPFFATLEALCVPRYNSKNPSIPAKYPLVLLTLERRDPALITTALARAPIPLSRVPNKKLKKALERMGIRWDSADWDGVEVWRGMAQPSIHGERG